MTFSSATFWRSVAVLVLAGAAVGVMHAATFACLVEPHLTASGVGGHDKGGYLGISFRDVNSDEITPMHLKNGHGAEILMVDHDGPAGQAGLREHDVVLSLNGAAVDGEEQLRKMLHDLPPGRTVSLVVCRDGNERTVNTTMANRGELEKRAWEKHWSVPQPAPTVTDDSIMNAAPEPAAKPPKSGFGYSLNPRNFLPTYTGANVDVLSTQLAEFFGVKDGKGLLVNEVEANSPAAECGLRAGDVVTKINGTRLLSKSDWNRALHEGKGHPINLTVVREHSEQTLTMEPDAKKRSAIERPAKQLPALMLR